MTLTRNLERVLAESKTPVGLPKRRIGLARFAPLAPLPKPRRWTEEELDNYQANGPRPAPQQVTLEDL